MMPTIKTTAEIELDIEVICDDCGATLKARFTDDRKGPRIMVEPCKHCCDESFENGKAEGAEESEKG
mgnify:CR=1 FL=1